jgi:protein SMG8
VITNISNNSLFAIPANQEFVYVHRFAHDPTNFSQILQSNFNLSSKSTANSFLQKQLNSTALSVNPFETEASVAYSSSESAPSLLDDNKLFRKFVSEHVNTALTEGFNDNIGRTNVAPLFELSTFSAWKKIHAALVDLFFNYTATSQTKSSKIQSYFSQLKSQIDIDAQFSENRCKKVLPSALSLYQENLPGHYTQLQHQQRVGHYFLFYTFIFSIFNLLPKNS